MAGTEIRALIEKIVNGDDDSFEPMVRTLTAGTVLAFARTAEGDDESMTFLNYLLENDREVTYIPIFSDEREIEDFIDEADIPDGYELYEFGGNDLAAAVSADQYLMINPVTGGIVFQGAHLKIFSAPPANDA